MTDAKSWVTIKIPERVRDTAQDDPRTYGDIMQAGLNTDATPEMEFEDWWSPDYAQTIAHYVREELDPDSGALAREVAREVDYAELANQVADELEARQ